MSLANNNPYNSQQLRDANFIVTLAPPTAGSTNNTNSLDLGPIVNFANGSLNTGVSAFPTTRYVSFNIQISASACTANNKNVNAYLQQTTTNSDGTANAAAWTNVPIFATPALRATDASGNMPLAQVNIPVPIDNLKRFYRVQMQTEANGGNPNTDSTCTFQLNF